MGLGYWMAIGGLNYSLRSGKWLLKCFFFLRDEQPYAKTQGRQDS